VNPYTDLTPPAGDIFYYQVEVRHPFGCEATRAVNHNSSRSNRSVKAPTDNDDDDDDISVNKIFAGVNVLRVYPNPVRNTLNVAAELSQDMKTTIQFIDIQGRVLNSQEVESRFGIVNTTINTTQVAPGIYQLRFITEKGVMIKKVVVNH
jgi:hypothetical protein